MNRKIYVFWLLLLAIFILSSCGSEKTDLRPVVNNKSEITYNLVKKSDTERNINIFYPQITTDNKIETNKINEIIKVEAKKVLNYYDNSSEGLDLDIDYNIQRADDEILSIQYSGVGSINGAAHPNNLFFTTNIDIQKATRVRLKDLIDISEEFITKIRSGEFSLLHEDEDIKQEILSNFSSYTPEEIDDLFKNADSLDNIGTENQSDIYSYFIKDSIGISVSVSHSSGDHAEFVMN